MVTPARDGHNFGVIGGSYDDRDSPLLLGLSDNFMNMGHIGTGGIEDHSALCLQRMMNSAALSVRADDDSTADRDFVDSVDGAHPLLGQMVDHILIVNDGAQHDTGLTLRRSCFCQFHGSAHAVTESGRLCQYDLHREASSRA